MPDIHSLGAIRKALSEAPAVGSDRYTCIYAIAASTVDLGYYHSIGQASRTFEMSHWHANVWSNVTIEDTAEAHVRDLAKIWHILNSLGKAIKKCDSYCKCPFAGELESLSRQAKKRFEIMQAEQRSKTGVFGTVKTVGNWLGGFLSQTKPQAFPLDSFFGRRAGQTNLGSGSASARRRAGENTTVSLRSSPSAVTSSHASQSRRAASPSQLPALPSRTPQESGDYVTKSDHRRDPRPLQASTVHSHAQHALAAGSRHRNTSEAPLARTTSTYHNNKRAKSPTPGPVHIPLPSARSIAPSPLSKQPAQFRPANSAPGAVQKSTTPTMMPPTRPAPSASPFVRSQSGAIARIGNPSNNPYRNGTSDKVYAQMPARRKGNRGAIFD